MSAIESSIGFWRKKPNSQIRLLMLKVVFAIFSWKNIKKPIPVIHHSDWADLKLLQALG